MSILLDMYLALMLWRTPSICASGAGERSLLRFAVTSVLTVCALAPFLFAVVGQAIRSMDGADGRRTIEDVAVQQYFERSPPFAVLSALVVVTAIVLWLGASAQLRARIDTVTLAAAWLVIPTAADRDLVGAGHPIYTPRYLSFHRAGDGTDPGCLHRRGGRKPWAAAATGQPLRCRRGAELYSGATQSVRQIRDGLQPGGRSDHREGSAG